MIEQDPEVADIVHYLSYGTPGGEYPSECRAALVTQVRNGRAVGLTVLNPAGIFFNPTVYYAQPKFSNGGTWHWVGDCR